MPHPGVKNLTDIPEVAPDGSSAIGAAVSCPQVGFELPDGSGNVRLLGKPTDDFARSDRCTAGIRLGVTPVSRNVPMFFGRPPEPVPLPADAGSRAGRRKPFQRVRQTVPPQRHRPQSISSACASSFRFLARLNSSRAEIFARNRRDELSNSPLHFSGRSGSAAYHPTTRQDGQRVSGHRPGRRAACIRFRRIGHRRCRLRIAGRRYRRCRRGRANRTPRAVAVGGDNDARQRRPSAALCSPAGRSRRGRLPTPGSGGTGLSPRRRRRGLRSRTVLRGRGTGHPAGGGPRSPAQPGRRVSAHLARPTALAKLAPTMTALPTICSATLVECTQLPNLCAPYAGSIRLALCSGAWKTRNPPGANTVITSGDAASVGYSLAPANRTA